MTKAATTAGTASPLHQTEEPSGSESAAAGHHQDAAQAGSATLALSMGQPGTRLDMVLGGPHPLLLDIVRGLARRAAQDHHAGTAGATSVPAKRVGTPKQDT